MLKFRVISNHFSDATARRNDNDVDFLLEEDNWDDFGFHTSYQVHISSKHTHGGAKYLGHIRIMKVGQKEKESQLLRKGLSVDLVFNELPEDFVSMSDSLDLFNGISSYFNSIEAKKEVVRALHIIIHKGDEYYKRVEHDACFLNSLCRNSGLDSVIFDEIREILFNEGVRYNLREQTIKVRFNGCSDEIELDFNPVKVDFDYHGIMPNGMVAFIGKNGAGKSSLLYKLAYLMLASPSQRPFLTHLGTIAPENIYIRQLMVFSYTPLDSFMMPGQSDPALLQGWLQHIKMHEGRFEYCGLRDIVREGEEIEARQQEEKKNAGELYKDIYAEKVCLKDVSALAEEAFDAYRTLMEEAPRFAMWRKLLNDMQQKGYCELSDIAQMLCDCEKREDWAKVYNRLSTGHKFFFHTMLHILAYVKHNAVLLFDEIENHLQAPLLSFMLANIKRILHDYKSVMLLATHSPIILQEIISANVRVVRRSGDSISLSKPGIETFGESFGAIAFEVFDMTSNKAGFYDVLGELYSEFSLAKRPLEEMIKYMREKLKGLSMQAINYIVNRYTHEKNVETE